MQGRLKEDRETYAFVQKAYETVRRDGLWWDMGVKGKMWRKIYDI